MKKSVFSLFVILFFVTACGDSSFDGSDEPIRIASGALTTCQAASDCLSDEACTQGGHCVNITGERDATEAIQADLDALPEAVGMGTPYRLPANATLQINDIDGDGVGLRID